MCNYNKFYMLHYLIWFSIIKFWTALDIIVLAISQIQQLISELNEILANDVVDGDGMWKKKLGSKSLQLFELLPQAIQAQLLLERDPHGNVQVTNRVRLLFYPTMRKWLYDFHFTLSRLLR